MRNLTDKPNHPRRLMKLIRNNRFARILRGHGYRFVSYSSGFRSAECITADLFIEPPDRVQLAGVSFTPSAFERGLLWWTPVESLIRQGSTLSPYVEHRERIRYVLNDLPEHVDNVEPEFVFAHVLTPHEPFVFGENGEDTSPYEIPFDLARIFDDPDGHASRDT